MSGYSVCQGDTLLCLPKQSLRSPQPLSDQSLKISYGFQP
jgi:hypothetical protein